LKINTSDVSANEDEDEDENENIIKDANLQIKECISFVASEEPDSISASIDGTSSMCAIISKLGQVRVLDLATNN